MKTKWAFPHGASLAVVLVLTTGVLLAVGYLADQTQPALVFSRTLEPVILTGMQLPAFEGVPGDQLFAFAYKGGSWHQLPLQLDKVTAAGMFAAGGGALDANDQLVFMAGDMGEKASPSSWITDVQSRRYVRYQVQVTNPLSPTEQAWVYVYRSTTLKPSPADYVNWDAANNQIVGGTYVLDFAPKVHAGANSLEMNGSGVNALDRTEIRIYAACHLPFPFPAYSTVLTENDLASAVTVTPTIDGPVRVGGGAVDKSAWSYRSIFGLSAEADIASFQPPAVCSSINVTEVRFSNDWLNPLDTGMAPAIYYDANTSDGVAIDGIPDPVAALPPSPWEQVSGGQGTIVEVTELATGGGNLYDFYKDDSTYDPTDTGDHRSYGNAGYRVDNPSGVVGVNLTAYVLDPSLDNIGAMYRSYYDHPLQVAAAQQGYGCSVPEVAERLPSVIRAGSPVTFTAVVTGGQAPFTYRWAFGGNAKIATGTPVTHTFQTTGTFPVTLTVTTACKTQASVVDQVPVTNSAGSPE